MHNEASPGLQNVSNLPYWPIQPPDGDSNYGAPASLRTFDNFLLVITAGSVVALILLVSCWMWRCRRGERAQEKAAAQQPTPASRLERLLEEVEEAEAAGEQVAEREEHALLSPTVSRAVRRDGIV